MGQSLFIKQTYEETDFDLYCIIRYNKRIFSKENDVTPERERPQRVEHLHWS